MKKWKMLLLIIAVAVGCKKPYNPGVIDSPKSYLIVEGVINTNDTTTIKLSRTVNLSSKVVTNPVVATVTVEGDNGNTYGLVEKAPGVYILAGVQLDGNPKYRLHIKTGDNNEYRSDFVTVKNAPPIDSIGFNLTAKGIQIYSNAHDAGNNTRYYRFDYVETWKFHSLYNSAWISNGVNDVVLRTQDQMVYFCYKSNSSTSITLGSTAKLTQDVLYQTPITAIESTSEKIETKYSILLRQYALTEDAYKFWESLRKNTEQLGSIFDAEPSQIAGNIHNINDNSDIVVGYISVGSVSTKRVFIASEQLPDSFSPIYPYQCQLDSLWYHNPRTGVNDVLTVLVPGIEVPAYSWEGQGPKPIGYLSADRYCIDCTLRGSKKQPDFWK